MRLRAYRKAKDFNPRSPRGGATIAGQARGYFVDISIHAPRKGERRRQDIWMRGDIIFQSTLPARGSD